MTKNLANQDPEGYDPASGRGAFVVEEIDSKTASRYRKECETGRRQVNRVIDGKQKWVDGPTVPEDELAAQSEALRRETPGTPTHQMS